MVCRQCKKDKDESEFYVIKSRPYRKKDGTTITYSNPTLDCKECKSFGKDKYYEVYILPFEWYVGMTNNIDRRMWQHKNAGKNISRHFVIFRSRRRKIAHLAETLLHTLGFNGF